MLYTFTQTCQELDIEPWRYLRDVLEWLPHHPPSGWPYRALLHLVDVPDEAEPANDGEGLSEEAEVGASV